MRHQKTVGKDITEKEAVPHDRGGADHIGDESRPLQTAKGLSGHAPAQIGHLEIAPGIAQGRLRALNNLHFRGAKPHAPHAGDEQVAPAVFRGEDDHVLRQGRKAFGQIPKWPRKGIMQEENTHERHHPGGIGRSLRAR